MELQFQTSSYVIVEQIKVTVNKMKNLKLNRVCVLNIDFKAENNFSVCHSQDENASDFVVTCCNNLKINKYDSAGKFVWSVDLQDLASPNNFPVNLAYLSFNNNVYVSLSNGEIYRCTIDGLNCDLVGVCDGGIQALEWSPDEELVVVVTKNLSAILMSCTFDPITEINLTSEEFGEKEFVTVGWGKKETQFHGSEGKQAAKTKVEINADPSLPIDTTVKITWRGDSQFYAIGFTIGGIRRFKVFDREGHLQYTSEKQPGLEANLSWNPNGNVIATTQKLPNKYVVAFFEKNGLKHGDFTIPVNTSTVINDLSWSSDSDILSLLITDTSNEFCQKILLFTSGNYHWYLKQTLIFNEYQEIHKMFWDVELNVANRKKLHVFLKNGTYLTYSWMWKIDHTTGKDDTDDAIVGVIDGNKLLLTGFRQAVIPPPMASLELTFENNINSVNFLSALKEKDLIDFNAFFVVTEDLQLHFYRQSSKVPLRYEKFAKIGLEFHEIPFEIMNWNWLDYKRVICLQYKDNLYNLFNYEIDFTDCSMTLRKSTLLPDPVIEYNVNPYNKTELFLQLNNGEILKYTTNDEIIPNEIEFPVVCPKFDIINVENDLYFIGLCHNNVLYVNNMSVLHGVSSYFVHTHFILITMMQRFLLCIELSKSGLKALTNYQVTQQKEIYKRKIETGAELVIVVPNDTRTVFQMPRGNLEVIQPRPLSLKIIGEYLDNFKYYEAFDLMRKQRINLNLLVDHNPDKFMNYIDVFLDSIKNNSWLNIFISDLDTVDVTKTMYSSSYSNRNNNDIYSGNDKVSLICDALRSHIVKRPDRDNKILPLLTTFVKKNTVEDLENALTIIKELKKFETNGSKLSVGSDESLKYLLYMVDVNQLFDIALGMYDFDLVLLIATKSQKDPKEYVPMLNEFNEMEENYKCFSVNKHLKRFHRAVECLAKCGPEYYSELRNFVKYHSLYSKALELISPDVDVYKQISDDYGLYLKLKKNFTEAGIVYRRAGNVDKAVECFKEALEWELAIELGCSWPKDKFQELCWDLANRLKDLKRHEESLILLEKYCDDQKETISYAVGCGHYKTALRLCSHLKETDMKDAIILPALVEEFNNLNELIKMNLCTFKMHKERLQIVRDKKSKKSEEFYDASFVNKDSDLYSDAGSTLASSTSRSSSRTFRSSKNRRKHERKVASLKEGSQYEDVALVMALHSLVTATFNIRSYVKEVNVALCCFDMDKEAMMLQNGLDKLLNEMKDSFKQIWTNELVLEATSASIAAVSVPEGCSIVPQGIATLEPHIRIAPIIKDVEWKLNGLQ